MAHPDRDIGCIPSSQDSQVTEFQGSQATESQGSQTRMLRNAGSGTGAWDTPIAVVSMTETSGQTYGVSDKTAEARYPRLAQEMASRFVGPMPSDQFLDIFLHRKEISKDGMPSASGAFTKVPQKATEVAIYRPMIEALNDNNYGRCPGFKFYDTHLHPDTAGPVAGNGNNVKPDICCYADGHATLVKTPKDVKEGTSVKNSHMGFAALYFEIKGSKTQDFFSDPSDKDVDRTSWEFLSIHGKKDNLKNLGQAINYAVEVCKRQHRHCCYSVSMSGSHTRLIRWDRAGAIVTESFDIRKRPEVLCDFLWCFAHVSDAERGYDLTVEPATMEQETAFRDAVQRHIPTQVAVKDPAHMKQLLGEHYQEGAVTLVSLLPSLGSDITELLISRPVAVPSSVAGRGTRAYWAVNPRSNQVVFLKDTWRYDMHSAGAPGDVERPEREGDILRLLQDAHVRNIPKVLYDQDVPLAYEVTKDTIDTFSLELDSDNFQTTLTQNYLDEPWVCGKSLIRGTVVKHTHYRMALDVVGYTLLRLNGTAELLHGAYNAFQALQDAHEKVHWVHRDISPGNIILYNGTLDRERVRNVRQGYLVDWDLSCGTGHVGLRQPYEVSTTWQFASYAICCNNRSIGLEARKLHLGTSPASISHHAPADSPRHLHTIEDDMESILYVVLYCALLWTPHNMQAEELRNALARMFDDYDRLDNLPQGGDGKSHNMTQRRYTRSVEWESKDIGFWLDTVLDYHAPRAGITPADRMGKWTVVHLDRFWRRFLQYRTSLRTNDRTNNLQGIPSARIVFSNRIPLHANPKPNQGTLSRGSVKRAAVAESLDLSPAAKRVRGDFRDNGNSTGYISEASAGTGSEPPESRYSDLGSGQMTRLGTPFTLDDGGIGNEYRSMVHQFLPLVEDVGGVQSHKVIDEEHHTRQSGKGKGKSGTDRKGKGSRRRG